MNLALLLLSVLSTGLLTATPKDGWPHLRGPALDGRASAEGAFDTGVGLELAWSVPLGPAYSGIAVSGGRVVTMFSDGTLDFVIALNAAGGAEEWRHELGRTYGGHDGSEDGPISSPVIGMGKVFALGPFGELVALDERTGELAWSKHLEQDFGATAPDYGFTSTPLLEGDLLIVQVGGTDGRLLCALAAETGELVWSLGEGAAGYASPTVMDLAGHRQVVVLNGSQVMGVDPVGGELLWSHALGGDGRAGSGMATALDRERFYALVSSSLASFRVTPSEEGFAVEELFRSRELGRTYATPVHHEGVLYGYKSDFLTAVDAETGERIWKSRPPGGRGLILVDDRLVLLGADGIVAVAAATPAGYEEEARVQALERTSYVWPSFADGRIFVRDSGALAAVKLVSGAVGTRTASASGAALEHTPAHAFGRFIRQVEEAQDKDALIEEFFAEQGAPPLQEDGFVHFVFRGEHEDVAIAGTMVEGRPASMKHVPGTDLYHLSFPIEAGMRWEYRYNVDFEDWVADALNPRSVPGREADEVLSEVAAEGYEAPTHLAEPQGGARGRIETYEFTSEQLGNTREVRVYLPAGYDDNEDDYPLLVVQRGPDWLDKGLMANTLDNLIGTSVQPLVVAFIGAIQPSWLESGGSDTKPFLDMLATEFVADLQDRYRLTSSARERGLMGMEGQGLNAVYCALLHPDVFGKVAVQSLLANDVAGREMFELLEASPEREVQFYVDWNRYGTRIPEWGVDFAVDSARLYEALQDKGYTVAGGQANDALGWGSWRARTDAILETLFPMN